MTQPLALPEQVEIPRMSSPTDAGHPIGVVSQRTGLTPDVLRVWERRYSVVKPKRTPGGQRLYSDSDIARLALLHRATRNGHGIGNVATLSRTKLEELVRKSELSGVNGSQAPGIAAEPRAIVDQAIMLAENLDSVRLEILLRRSFARYGTVVFLDMIAAPFLRSVGDAWHAGRLSVSQEHLATALVQRVVTQTAPPVSESIQNPTLVVATLAGERHSSGALMAATTAASAGWHVVYLGADLPAREIADAAMQTGAMAVGISVVFAENTSAVVAKLRELTTLIPPEISFLIGGAGAKKLNGEFRRTRVAFIDSMFEMQNELASIQGRFTVGG